MKEDQLSLVLFFLEHHDVLTIAELTKEIAEFMEDDQLYIVLHILDHCNVLELA